MSAERIKKFGEVFTPPELINEILDKLPVDIWKDTNKKWLDPTCGDGAFLIEIKRRLKKARPKRPLKSILKQIYGVDIQEDNCIECIKKLYEVTEVKSISTQEVVEYDKEGYLGMAGIKHLFIIKTGNKRRLVRNIVCADGLTYQYNFGEDDDTIDGKGQYKLNF
jgi:hypothetical protein